MTPDATRHPKLRLFWKIVGIFFGGLLLLVGLAMLVTPGPGVVFVLAGLALLSPHSRRAHQVMSWLKQKLRLRQRPESPHAPADAPEKSVREDRRARG